MWNIKRLIFKVSSVALNLLKLTKVMEFIPSSKSNKQLLVLDGHIYSQQKKLAGNIILWDCINRRKANGVEGWHNAFNRSVGLSHANVWRFFTCVLYEHVTMYLRITQDSAGVPADPPSRTYNVLNQQIQTIVRDYANRNTVHYLRYLAYLI